MHGYKYHGIVLVELMMAVTLGLLMLGFLLHMYLGSQSSMELQKNMHMAEYNAKAAMQILQSEIHKAGTIGCARLTADFPIISYAQYSITPENKLIGQGASQISIRYADMPGVALKARTQSDSVLYTEANVRFNAGDVLLVSDCNHAEIFQVEKVSITGDTQKIITHHPLQNHYEALAEIGRLEMHTFFIAPAMRNSSDSNDNALFMEDIKQRKTELITGISKLQILYTIMLNGKLVDVAAQDVTNWSQVKAVAIDLESSSSHFKQILHGYIILR